MKSFKSPHPPFTTLCGIPTDKVIALLQHMEELGGIDRAMTDLVDMRISHAQQELDSLLYLKKELAK